MEPSAGDVVRRVKSAGRREHPEEVRKALDRLRGAADARPELKGVVDVAVAAVEAARDEVRDAVVRAELAEATLSGVKPHVDELAERAESLERNVAQRSAIDAARDERAYQAEQHRKDWTPSPEQVAQIGKMAGQVEDLRAAQTAQAAGVAKAVQLLVCIHKAVKNEDGKSPIQCFKESGEWTVSDADDGVIAVCAKRSDAIQLVSDLLAEELAEADAAKSADQDEEYRPDDTMHRPAPWRGKKKPEQAPAPGPIEYGVSRRKRKQARIL